MTHRRMSFEMSTESSTAKVYLAWNDGDYYGPHPVGNLVYATLEAAKRACEAEPYCRKGGEWKSDVVGGRWDYSIDSYSIEEVEPEP